MQSHTYMLRSKSLFDDITTDSGSNATLTNLQDTKAITSGISLTTRPTVSSVLLSPPSFQHTTSATVITPVQVPPSTPHITGTRPNL